MPDDSTQEKREQEPGGRPSTGSEVFLAACPVCARGQVVKDVQNDREESYVCTRCSSRLSETIFGFIFVTVDERYVKKVDEVKSQTFTKPRLFELSSQAAATGEPALGGPAAAAPRAQPERPPERPAPAARPPAQPAARAAPPSKTPPESAEEAQPSEEGLDGRALLKELMGERESPPEGAAQEDLWWEVDEDEAGKE